MCINPSNIWVQRGPKWEQTPVPCKTCWRCKQNRVNDYVARALCEAQTSQAVATVTLTYAPRDDLADKVLTPRHFQLFMKLLRRAGHKVRYLVAGEFGDLKGRVHFHAILFFQDLIPLAYENDDGEWIVRGQQPRYIDDYAPGTSEEDWGPFCREIPHKRMVHIREWPHGHITCDWSASEKSARYVCKYLLAEDKNNAWFSLSKKPALGAAWFAKKAETARNLSVLPSSFEYVPPGGNRDKPYLMTGATRRDYLAAIGATDDDRRKMSQWVQLTYDKHKRTADKKRLADAETLNLRLNGMPEIEVPKWFEGEPVFEPDPDLPTISLRDQIFNPRPSSPRVVVQGVLAPISCAWPRKSDKLSPYAAERRRLLHEMYDKFAPLGYDRGDIWRWWQWGARDEAEFFEKWNAQLIGEIDGSRERQILPRTRHGLGCSCQSCLSDGSFADYTSRREATARAAADADWYERAIAHAALCQALGYDPETGEVCSGSAAIDDAG